jgi:hypothetical protein
MRNMKYHCFMTAIKYYAYYYPWLASFLGLLVPNSLYEGARKHFEYSTEKLYKRIDRGDARKDITGTMLKEGMQRHMTRPEIEATGALITIGAAETTSSALTAAINLLVRHPRTLKRLQDELRGTFDSEDSITFASIEHLEYLNAVLKEAMRYAPPVPMQVPFLSPKEGGWIAGRYIPPNVRPPTYPFSMHYTKSTDHGRRPPTSLLPLLRELCARQRIHPRALARETVSRRHLVRKRPQRGVQAFYSRIQKLHGCECGLGGDESNFGQVGLVLRLQGGAGGRECPEV